MDAPSLRSQPCPADPVLADRAHVSEHRAGTAQLWPEPLPPPHWLPERPPASWCRIVLLGSAPAPTPLPPAHPRGCSSGYLAGARDTALGSPPTPSVLPWDISTHETSLGHSPRAPLGTPSPRPCWTSPNEPPGHPALNIPPGAPPPAWTTAITSYRLPCPRSDLLQRRWQCKALLGAP